MRCLVCIGMLVMHVLTVHAQERDSLWAVWNDESAGDTARFDAIARLIKSHYLYKLPDSAMVLAQEMEALAAQKQLPIREADALGLQGNCWYVRGDLIKARALHYRAIALFGKARYAPGVAGSLGDIGTMMTDAGELKDGAAYQQRSLDLYTLIGNEGGMARSNNNLGRVLLMEGDFTRAVAHLLAAIKLHEKAGDRQGAMTGYGNLSVIMAQQKDFAKATEYAERGLTITEELGNKQMQTAFLANLGAFAVDEGRFTEGIAYHERALALGREMRSTRGMMLSLYNIGSAYGTLGQYGKAQGLMHESLALAREMKDPYREAIALSGLATTYETLGDHAQAIALGEKALSRFREMGITEDIGTIAKVLSKAYRATKDNGRALEMYELHVQMRDSVMSEENQRGVLRQEYAFDNEKRALADSLQFAADKAIQVKEIQKQKIVRNGFMGGFALVALFAGVFLFQRNRISREKARSEELLLNILPSEVAEELKAKGSAEAVQIDQVTVLFSDFKGFTVMSEKMTPKELVRDLNECFSAFDHITAKYGIEKIKTIGDAYMAAGGLPVPNTSHALDVVRAGLEMRDIVAESKARKLAAGLPFFEVRIGIHTGPVVAGIVGVKKFSYDIWGDTVNTASRMESSGAVNEVNISQTTYALVHNETDLSFVPRGLVSAKGKGELEMFFVQRASH